MLSFKCFMTFRSLSRMPESKIFIKNLLNGKHPSYPEILPGLKTQCHLGEPVILKVAINFFSS